MCTASPTLARVRKEPHLSERNPPHGVELSEHLSAIVRENVLRIRRRKCNTIEIVTGNAETFAPPDDMSHAFFFNPFYPPIIDSVRDKMRASLNAHPRPLTIYYLSPMCDKNHVTEWDFVKRVDELPTGDPSYRRIFVYQNRLDGE